MSDEAKVTSALDVYLKCLQGQTKAEDNVQKSLAQLRGAAGAATFELKNQWYQVRERKGRLYLCELDGKPKGRPKKTPEQKEHDRIERERRRAEAEAEEEGEPTLPCYSEHPQDDRDAADGRDTNRGEDAAGKTGGGGEEGANAADERGGEESSSATKDESDGSSTGETESNPVAGTGGGNSNPRSHGTEGTPTLYTDAGGDLGTPEEEKEGGAHPPSGEHEIPIEADEYEVGPSLGEEDEEE